jgi:putative membrane protein
MNRVCLILAVASLTLPAYAQAPQQSPANTAKSDTNVSSETRQFVEKAAIGDMYEIQSSRIVLDKLQNREFQDFARKITDDHTKSSTDLKSIVKGMGNLQVPTQLDDKHKRMVDQLQSASGPDLARQYKSQQIQAHKDAVQLYQDYSKQGDNTRIKQFAETTLPRLQEHQKMAQDLPDNPQVAQGAASDQRTSTQNQKQSGAAKQQQAGQQKGQGQQAQIISRPGPNHMMASQLRGTRVYGANDAHVGEIDDVVLTTEGEIAAVVVGVGGFLGVGEKNVAIPFSELEVRESASTTGMANRNQQARTGDQQTRKGTAPVEPQRILLRGMTKEELERAPNFSVQNN